jgi:hypothetical protein
VNHVDNHSLQIKLQAYISSLCSQVVFSTACSQVVARVGGASWVFAAAPLASMSQI